eukprot:CAMPEP_0194411664 /NCGR_PEP_ID=MMETSP0176-20130528/9909_1 /TAXON_ID=216777 /ORGANISM="Proboscia alata, Strain PI-D3" /LENGTH=434 /DNA_ID=CAMNT_0039213823 /DNA_START=43 /DNA_END=1347 /DNA_ORIENTATION=+
MFLNPTTNAFLCLIYFEAINPKHDNSNFVMALKANSWQKRLDRAFLDVDVKSGQARFRSFQRALQDPNLAKDVKRGVQAISDKGFGKGHPELIDALWPEGTIARSDIEGIQALTKSLPERIEEIQSSPLSVSSLQSVFSKLEAPDPAAVFSAASTRFFSDPNKVLKLSQNALRSNPSGIETLDYTLARKSTVEVNNDGNTTSVTFEIRNYPEFKRVSTPLSLGNDYTLENMGTALLELSSFLVLGNNVGKELSEMTSPFVMEESEMWIPLPRNFQSCPLETKDPLAIKTTPARTAAVLSFKGICTNPEIKRQTKILLDAVNEDLTISMSSSTVQVMQYNAPGTLPWRRKNEIAILVENVDVVDSTDESPVEDSVNTTAVGVEVRTLETSDEGVVEEFENIEKLENDVIMSSGTNETHSETAVENGSTADETSEK